MYSLAFIARVRCPCRPPLRFDTKDAVFILINQCRLISASLVSSLIFVSMGVGKSLRTPSTLFFAPTIVSRALGWTDSGFAQWNNLYNLLKR